MFSRSLHLPLALVLVAAALVSRFDWAGQPTIIVGRADVRDGDSLNIGRKRVRLEGIDAPELAQSCRRAGRSWPCGKQAKRHLSRLIDSHSVECAVTKRDRFNRLLARCKVMTRDLNRSMVRDGMAVSFGRAYSDEEAAARRHRQGLWAGQFERPQQWRRKNQRR